MTSCAGSVDTDAAPCKHRINHADVWYPHQRHWTMAGKDFGIDRLGHIQRCEPVTCPRIKLTGVRMPASLLTFYYFIFRIALRIQLEVDMSFYF